jgi:hypothetical protein
MRTRRFLIALFAAAMLSVAYPASSQTINASDYFPLAPSEAPAGAASTYESAPDGSLFTFVLGADQTNVHDVLTRSLTDQYGSREYYAVDAQGVRLLRIDVPATFGDGPLAQDLVTYFRLRPTGQVGVPIVPATFSLPTTTVVNVDGRSVPAAGFNPIDQAVCNNCHNAPALNVTGTVTAEALQSVTVPAGVFSDALRLRFNLTLRDSANNIVGTQNTLTWWGRGVGLIQEQDLTDSSSTTLTWSSRIQPSAPAMFAATLPTSRSVAVGVPATAFATIINSSSTLPATGCRIQPMSNIPAIFVYQTTDPATNALKGAANTPVDIGPGVAQSFVIALTPTAPFDPTEVRFSFSCENSNVAPIFVGLDTLLLSGSATPVPDLIALAATLGNDGIVNIPDATGTGVFAVASANVGSAGTITVSADTGGASLPLSVLICQTNPTTGLCITPTGASVTTTVDALGTPTFAISVVGAGNVPFDPAGNRIFVRFRDGNNVVRGATSVAVRTQ